MNFQAASNHAYLALAVKSNDPVALKLMADARNGLAQSTAAAQEQRYQAALSAGRAALAASNFDGAILRAQEAQTLKPGDPAAAGLAAEAQRQKDMVAAAPPPGTGVPATTAAPTSPTSNGGAHPPLTNRLGMEFVWCGTVPPDGAYVGRYEVTQKQFAAVVGKPSGEQRVEGSDYPVANVTFQEAKDFCDRLGKSEGKRCALPTKDEWLALAGLSAGEASNAWSVLSGSGRLELEVTSWKAKTTLRQPAVVGSRGAQANGLCDVFGNVREWLVGEQSAGFSYDTEGFGIRKALFLPAESARRDDLRQVTGLRCILRDNP
jgi:formylglycine-generating enzyme required for sulfatase activity